MSKAKNNESVQAVELGDLLPTAPAGKPAVERNFGLIKNVKVRLTAQVGSCEVSVGELFALAEGGVLRLDQAPTAAMEVLLDGQVIARGDLVVVDDRFGIQIRELVKE
jgi:flagellar motor switch protein FliN/FliY